MIAARLLLDFAGCDPNPARDAKVKLPKQVREEPQPPSAEHVLAILDALGKKWRLMFVTIEQGALRLEAAAQLKWGDVDVAGLRLRLPRSATKRDKARWIYLPEWLMQAIEQTCPLDDRVPERRVSRDQGSELLPGDETRLRHGEDSELFAARPTPPEDHRLASVRGGGPRARGARRPCSRVDEPRRL